MVKNRFVIGDGIQFNNLTGEVQRIIHGDTYLRDARKFHYNIPNGEVIVIANQIKDWTRAEA